MKSTRAIVITWIAFALPVLVLAAVLWHGPGAAVAGFAAATGASASR